MHQIYITSLVTTLLVFFLIGGFIKWRSDKADLKLLALLFLIELPMALAAYYLLRMPVVDFLFHSAFGSNPAVYGFIRNFYAPLTEEPVKLLPLLLPFLRNRINRENFVMAAMALGLGFGIGEIWLVARFISENQQYVNFPWYYFGGFMNERFMVCIVHAGMTSFALSRLNNKFILGLLGSMGMHFIGNFPIYLSKINFGNFGPGIWQGILVVWILLFFFAMMLLLVYFKQGSFKVGKFLHGNSVCPECRFEYPAPLLVMNWFTKRYERCPNCKKWHWVKMWNKDKK